MLYFRLTGDEDDMRPCYTGDDNLGGPQPDYEGMLAQAMGTKMAHAAHGK